MEVVYDDTVELEDRLIITNNWATRVYGQACMDSMETSSLKARIKWISQGLWPSAMNLRTHPTIYTMYRKDTSIRQAPVFRHLRALRKSPMEVLYLDE